MQGSWGATEFKDARFHDARYMKSATEAAELIAAKRGASFSAAVGDRLRQSVGDMFASEKVTPEVILSGHYAATVDRCAQCEDDEILIAHDTTSFNYSWHKSVQDLGPLNDRKTNQGIYVHSGLAMTLAGTPLGMMFVQIWTRGDTPREITPTERAALPIAEKESYRWLECQNECGQKLKDLLDSGKTVTVIGDRENDIMEVLAEPRHPHLHLLVRVGQNRRVESDDVVMTIDKALDAAVDQAQYTLKVPESANQSERDAKMRVKYITVEVQPPKEKRSFLKPQRISVVHTYEWDPPANQKPIVWTLWSTRPVENLDQALATIERYKRRWIIERLHFTLKTGAFNVEKLQFDDFHTLSNALAFYYITAWSVLALVYLSREQANAPAEDYIEKNHLIILRHAAKKTVATLLEAVKAIAQLAGYANYPRSPLPGIKMIWAGVVKLNDMVAGAKMYAELQKLHGAQLDF